MGTRNPLPSETNRNLDFTILNKEAVGPAFLVLNLEGTRGSRFWAPQNVGGAICSQSNFFFFF